VRGRDELVGVPVGVQRALPVAVAHADGRWAPLMTALARADLMLLDDLELIPLFESDDSGDEGCREALSEVVLNTARKAVVMSWGAQCRTEPPRLRPKWPP